MEIKTTYIADDGEEFETEEECRAYEEAWNPGDAILFLDQDFQPLYLRDSVARFEWATYVFIKDAEKARKFFEVLNNECGYDVPDQIEDRRLYWWKDQEYVDLNSYIADLQIARNHCRAAIASVYGSIDIF